MSNVYQEATPENLQLVTYKMLPLDSIYWAAEKFALHVVETSIFFTHKVKKKRDRVAVRKNYKKSLNEN